MGEKAFPSKAIIYSHLASLSKNDIDQNKVKWRERYSEIFKPYIKCQEYISVCYFYVDISIKEVINNTVLKATLQVDDSELQVPGDLMERENRVIDELEKALNVARESLKQMEPQSPIFEFFGLQKLIALLREFKFQVRQLV